MTPEEATEILEEIKELDDTLYAYSDIYMKALETAISALKEIKQYRKIGSVKECREAVDKQKPKKPIKQKGNCFSKGKSGEEQHEIILICPLCGGKALKRGYPCKCGQAIQWDEDLEDIENGT